MVDKLAQSQLVVRTVSPRDARARILSLTPSGEELREPLLDGLIAVTPLAFLSSTEQIQLTSILQKLGAS